jgi:Putative adhesin
MHRSLLLIAVLTAAVSPARAQESQQVDRNAFSWSGDVPAGSWIEVRNLNGSIHVSAASGGKTEVSATKSWRRGDPRDVRFEVIKLSRGGALVCALWGQESSCDEAGYHSADLGVRRRDNDVEVEFTVRVPAGVKVNVGTVNGGVDVAGAGAEVVAATVNGAIDASTSVGPVTATTVNGDVRAAMRTLAAGDDMRFETVNGDVVVLLPADFDADVDMSTVNGRLRSDFPVTVKGTVNPHHLRATIGKGGRRLTFRTVNGNLELRKQG